MPKLLRKNVKTGDQVIHYGKVTCHNCKGIIPSEEENCPHCGAIRDVNYKIEEIKIGEVVTNEDDLAKAKGGALACPYCGKLTWKYNAVERKYACANGCGGDTGEKSAYEMAGGEPEVKSTTPTYIPMQARTISQSGMPLWKKALIGTGGLIVIGLLIWLIVGVSTTHEVTGHVESVSWVRSAHQEENILRDGSGFGLPANATPVGTPESKIADYEDNIVGYTHDTYEQLSTPEVIDYTFIMIPAETPGAKYTTVPVECGDPTPMPGGFVSYEKCFTEYQEDSTWGEIKSDLTPVYAPQIMVEMTTEPTPVYGTPTPIYRDWYVYTFWEWVNIGALPDTSGNNNELYWPSGQIDDLHRVVNDAEHYTVVIEYDNGKTFTYEGSDPALLQKYLPNEKVVGKFNVFDGFVRDDQ